MCGRVCELDVDPGARELLDRPRECTGAVLQLYEQHFIDGERVAGPRQRRRGQIAVGHEQAHDVVLLLLTTWRGDGEEIDAARREIAAQFGEDTGLVRQPQLELRRTGHDTSSTREGEYLPVHTGQSTSVPLYSRATLTAKSS